MSALDLIVQPAESLALAWDRRAVETLLAEGREPAGPLWRLEGLIDERFAMIRVLSAVLENGSVLGVVALRPSDAAGHGEELTAGLIAEPGDDDPKITIFSETLVSTEYTRDGVPRRLVLELYGDDDEGPARGAAVIAGDPGDDPDAVFMRVTLDGVDGEGLFERNRLR